MTWDEVLTRMEEFGLQPEEETYMENYGKILTAQRPEFRERAFRCTHGVVRCCGISVEIFLFPDPIQRNDFIEVIGNDPWWMVHENVALHFPECDLAILTKVLSAIA